MATPSSSRQRALPLIPPSQAGSTPVPHAHAHAGASSPALGGGASTAAAGSEPETRLEPGTFVSVMPLVDGVLAAVREMGRVGRTEEGESGGGGGSRGATSGSAIGTDIPALDPGAVAAAGAEAGAGAGAGAEAGVGHGRGQDDASADEAAESLAADVAKKARELSGALEGMKRAAINLPGGHLGTERIWELVRVMDAEIAQRRRILDTFRGADMPVVDALGQGQGQAGADADADEMRSMAGTPAAARAR